MTAWGKNPYLILDLNFTFKLHNQSIDDFLYVSWTIKSSSWAIMLLKIKLSDTKKRFFSKQPFSHGAKVRYFLGQNKLFSFLLVKLQIFEFSYFKHFQRV